MNEPPRPRWLSEHWHAIGWLVFASVALVLYVWVHKSWRGDYIEHIGPQVADAVELYVLRPNVVTGALELRVGDVPYTFDRHDQGPLGIGTLPEARGVLTRASAIVERYNLALRNYIDGIMDGFYPSPNNQHHMLVPLSTVNPNAVVKERSSGSNQGENWFVLRVTVESFSHVRHEYPNEQTLDALIDLARGAELIRIQQGRKNEIVLGTDGTDGTKPNEVVQAVGVMSGKRADLRKAVNCLFEIPASSACERPPCNVFAGCPNAEDGPGGAKSPKATNETLFHRQLRRVVERNIGFFWVSGKYLWYEIMMLAALGVVTRKLVLFAADYAGVRANRIWQPRESIRTLMQFAVAPVFSLVIIWILTLTHIISVKPLIGDVWSNGTVPIAFLLGLFPLLGYNVLHGLAEGVFGRKVVEEKAAEAKPVEIPDPSSVPADGAAASFERLRQRVRHHATAVLRH